MAPHSDFPVVRERSDHRSGCGGIAFAVGGWSRETKGSTCISFDMRSTDEDVQGCQGLSVRKIIETRFGPGEPKFFAPRIFKSDVATAARDVRRPFGPSRACFDTAFADSHASTGRRAVVHFWRPSPVSLSFQHPTIRLTPDARLRRIESQ